MTSLHPPRSQLVLSRRPAPFRHMVPLVAACAVVGCSNSNSRSGAVPVYPVEGRLFVGRKPALGAVISFKPDGEGPMVTAKVHDDGRFVPAQTDGAVGLAEGRYSLTATWEEGGADRFAGKHADPTKPLARLTVKRGFNLIPPIQLP